MAWSHGWTMAPAFSCIKQQGEMRQMANASTGRPKGIISYVGCNHPLELELPTPVSQLMKLGRERTERVERYQPSACSRDSPCKRSSLPLFSEKPRRKKPPTSRLPDFQICTFKPTTRITHRSTIRPPRQSRSFMDVYQDET